MTLDMPRHKFKTPSLDAIWYVLRNTPVGVGVALELIICILVYSSSVSHEARSPRIVHAKVTLCFEVAREALPLSHRSDTSRYAPADTNSLALLRVCRASREEFEHVNTEAFSTTHSFGSWNLSLAPKKRIQSAEFQPLKRLDGVSG